MVKLENKQSTISQIKQEKEIQQYVEENYVPEVSENEK